MSDNYYHILGISCAASHAEIKQAAQRILDQVKTAYAVLSNPATRRQYDKNIRLSNNNAVTLCKPSGSYYSEHSLGLVWHLIMEHLVKVGYDTLANLMKHFDVSRGQLCHMLEGWVIFSPTQDVVVITDYAIHDFLCHVQSKIVAPPPVWAGCQETADKRFRFKRLEGKRKDYTQLSHMDFVGDIN